MTESKREVGNLNEWIKVRNFPRYEISDDGMIYDTKFDRFTVPSNNNGYLWVWLVSEDGTRYKKSIHRLVYESFVGVIPEGMEVNHRDEVKGNNHIGNLELLTKKENCNYGTRNKKISKANSKPIYQYSMSGVLIKAWNSITEAEKANFSRTGISECCNGHRPYLKGYIWSFDERYRQPA